MPATLSTYSTPTRKALGIADNKMVWQLNSGDSYSGLVGNASIADGRWYHVVGTWDGAYQRIYINGAQDAWRTYNGNGHVNSTNEPITIGRTIEGSGNPARYFGAQVDDVRIWNYARSQQDIQSDRFHRLRGDEAGLMAYWPMDEAIGSTFVVDISDHDNAGSLQDGAGLVASTVPSN